MSKLVIIKRRRVVAGGGHHGGAWKVAYADFVTAMMAFFLLMWLLNATTEEQRKGLADYFDPSVPISPVSGGGTDMLSGDSIFTTEALAASGRGGVEDETRRALAEAAAAALSDLVAADRARVTLSDEGVVVDLIDADGAPLFSLGEAAASDLLRRVVEDVAPVLADSGRPIRFVGHTDDLPFRSSGYTNWELSADRANAARRLAVVAGLPAERVESVTGRADRQPLSDDPSTPENRRISLIMLSAPAPGHR